MNRQDKLLKKIAIETRGPMRQSKLLELVQKLRDSKQKKSRSAAVGHLVIARQKA